MWEELKSFKGYIFLFLFFCACVGGIFAFIVYENWSSVSLNELTPPLIFSKPFFFVFSVFAYLLQGLAFGIIHERKDDTPVYETASTLFWVQFLLGLIWLPLFFVVQSAGFAALDLFVVIMVLIFTYRFFREISEIAAFMLIPYALEIVIFAFLNGYIYVI